MTVSQPVCLGVRHPIGVHDQFLIFPSFFFFFFFCRSIALLFALGRPLWREDGSVICSALCQWSELRRTHNHTLLSHLRLLGSLSVASYDSQGLRWKYSYPPPHREENKVEVELEVEVEVTLQLTVCQSVSQSVSMSRYRAHSETCDQILLSVRKLSESCCPAYLRLHGFIILTMN
jgi:hypothetical protein